MHRSSIDTLNHTPVKKYAGNLGETDEHVQLMTVVIMAAKPRCAVPTRPSRKSCVLGCCNLSTAHFSV